MLIFLNGRFVPESRAVVSVFDRGFLYGDGLFETIRVCNGQPFRWAQHMGRLQRGAKFLRIKLPFLPEDLLTAAEKLIAKNKMPDALLRITLSRGVGARGYSPKGANSPTLMMTLHPLVSDRTGVLNLPYPGPLPKERGNAAPRLDELRSLDAGDETWRLIISSVHLPAGDALARFKTANKLPQILARAEADEAGADEALLLDSRGRVLEATAGNVFWVSRDVVCTPPLSAGILPGVTRAVVLQLCRKLKIKTREMAPRPAVLLSAQGVFLTLSSRGIVEVVELDGRKLRRSPLVGKLRAAYAECLRAETA